MSYDTGAGGSRLNQGPTVKELLLQSEGCPGVPLPRIGSYSNIGKNLHS